MSDCALYLVFSAYRGSLHINATGDYVYSLSELEAHIAKHKGDGIVMTDDLQEFFDASGEALSSLSQFNLPGWRNCMIQDVPTIYPRTDISSRTSRALHRAIFVLRISRLSVQPVMCREPR